MRATPRLVSLRGKFQNSRRASPPFFIFESPPRRKTRNMSSCWAPPKLYGEQNCTSSWDTGSNGKDSQYMSPLSCLLSPPREFHITRDRKSTTGMKSRGLNCFHRPTSIVQKQNTFVALCFPLYPSDENFR